MSNIVVVAFDNPDEAQQVATTISGVAKSGGLALQDMQVVVKDADGKINLKDEAGHPVAYGAIAGGVIGGMLFFFMAPVGIAAGAAIGGMVGHHFVDLDKKFVESVNASLKPNTSAIFLQLGNDTNTAALVNALEPYKGKLIQTNLSDDLEKQLKRVLDDETPPEKSEI